MKDSEILKEVHNDVKDLTVEVAKIRQDVNYHIKRTDLLEEKVVPSYNAYISVKNAGKFLLMILPLLALILKYLNVI